MGNFNVLVVVVVVVVFGPWRHNLVRSQISKLRLDIELLVGWLPFFSETTPQIFLKFCMKLDNDK